MASTSYESLTFYCSSQEEEDEEYEAQNLSGDDEGENTLSMYMPNLSIQREGEEKDQEVIISSRADEEVGGYGSDNESSGGKIMMMKKEEEEEEIGKGLMIITRPKGGRRSLCMDMCEVKACHELGFDLEHERMLQLPSRLSLSMSPSPLDNTSPTSGTNSPISNWRLSSPGTYQPLYHHVHTSSLLISYVYFY